MTTEHNTSYSAEAFRLLQEKVATLTRENESLKVVLGIHNLEEPEPDPLAQRVARDEATIAETWRVLAEHGITLGSLPGAVAHLGERLRIAETTIDELAGIRQQPNPYPLRVAVAHLRHTWDRLTACVDELGPESDACGEYQDQLDTAVLAVLNAAKEGPQEQEEQAS